MASVHVGRLSELAEAVPLVVKVGGREIGIIKFGGRVYAVRNRCPHQGAPLCRGLVGQGILHDGARVGSIELDESNPAVLTCPWHQWEFNLASGRPYGNTKLRVRVYETRVDGDDVYVDLDAKSSITPAVAHDVAAQPAAGATA